MAWFSEGVATGSAARFKPPENSDEARLPIKATKVRTAYASKIKPTMRKRLL